MDPQTNPYAPGAGAPPPELAGRDEVIRDSRVAIQRNKLGRHARSFMFVGLRGVGKTVLLNKIKSIAKEEQAIVNLIEAEGKRPLSITLIGALRSALFELDSFQGVSEKVKRSLRVLKSFAGAIKLKHGEAEISIGVENEPGVADSGSLTRDLTDLFIAAGEAAKSQNTVIALLIDEIQNLPPVEIEALIMAVHRVNQELLPIMIFGAGLPSLLKSTGSAKSYAERLFDYRKINSLDETEARRALVMPAANLDVTFLGDAVGEVLKWTRGYPYFLQEWGYQAWNVAANSPIGLDDIAKATEGAMKRLDEGFFLSRYVRLSTKQKEYLRAMAKLGPGPHNTGEVEKTADKASQQFQTTYEELIKMV